MKHIMKCTKCGKYTMKETCCSTKSVRAMPPKYSPDDRYADYRREAKMEQFKERGLI